MDKKGITWASNIYQKFEAMCLEVEEIMYEDTVKYVENQVQTVGDSVKKFYSDVMLDLLPPSPLDPTKEAVSDSLVKPNNDIGNYRMPKGRLKEKHVEVDDTGLLTEDQKMLTDNKPDHTPASHEHCCMEMGEYSKRSLSKKLNLGTTKNSGTLDPSRNEIFKDSFVRLTSSSEEAMEVNDIVQFPGYQKLAADDDSGHSPTSHGVCHMDYLHPIFLGDSGRMTLRKHSEGSRGTNRSSGGEKLSPSEPSGLVGNRLTSSCKSSNDNPEASCDQKARTTPPAPVDITEHDSAEENRNQIENEQMLDNPINKPPSALINLADSGRSTGMEMKFSSCGSPLEESDGADISMNTGVISMVESAANGSLQCSKFANEEFFSSNSGRSDDWGTDVNKDGIAFKQEMEITHQVEKAKLEETCVMVNGDEFHFVPHSEGESKPYKKNIQDIFSSRKRSMRKQEYEQLAVWYGTGAEIDQELKTSVATLTGKGSPSRDFCESEWELL